jgi:hypothetical protein
MRIAPLCFIIVLVSRARAQPRGVFCPSASHYFNFNTSAPVDSVTWSQATVRFVNNATFSNQRSALVLQHGGYAQFNWLEAGSTALTLVTWVYADAFQDEDGGTIFSLGVADSSASPDTPKHVVYARTLSASNSVEIGHGVEDELESAVAEAALVPHTWSHLAAVFALDGSIAIYVNGTLRAVNVLAKPVPYAVRMSSYIGRSQLPDTGFFTGAIADFGMYYEQLSSMVVWNLFTGNVSGCPEFQLATNFSSLQVGRDAAALHFFEGEMFNFAVYNYDLLTVLFADTFADVSTVTRTSTFLFVTVITSLLMACVVILVIAVAMSAGPRRPLRVEHRKLPISYKSRELSL